MSISDEAVCCTGQIKMLNGLLILNLIGLCCCVMESISSVINSSKAEFNTQSLMMSVKQAENFKQADSGVERSKHTERNIQRTYV